MDHKANMYIAMTPAGRMDWFTTFLTKYYLWRAEALDVCCDACCDDDEHHIHDVYFGSS
jgi:hypothetical protein